jgi:hypothetical protein
LKVDTFNDILSYLYRFKFLLQRLGLSKLPNHEAHKEKITRFKQGWQVPAQLGAKYSLKSSQNLPKVAKLLFFQEKPKTTRSLSLRQLWHVVAYRSHHSIKGTQARRTRLSQKEFTMASSWQDFDSSVE